MAKLHFMKTETANENLPDAIVLCDFQFLKKYCKGFNDNSINKTHENSRNAVNYRYSIEVGISLKHDYLLYDLVYSAAIRAGHSTRDAQSIAHKALYHANT